MARFSRALGRWVSNRPSRNATHADPYGPHSAAYGERHAAHVTELPGGLVRVDLGEPVKRLPSEPPAVRLPSPAALLPVSHGAPPVSHETPAADPAEPPKGPRPEPRAITREP